MESFDPLDSEYIPNYFTYETVNLMNQDDVSVILYPGKIDEFTTEGNESTIKPITKEDIIVGAPDSTLYDTNDYESEATRCPVCGIGDVGKHYHYGGRACSSCRAFFRRSVQNSSFKKFKCRNINAIGAPLQSSNSTAIIIDNTIVDNIENETRISSSLALIDSNNERVLPLETNYCKIDSRSWKSCRYCRFQRCLSCGLKPSWVLTKQQRNFRQQKRVKSKPGSLISTNKDNRILKTLIDQQRSVLHSNEILPLTEEEVNCLLKRIQSMTALGTGIFLRYFTNKPEVFVEMIRAVQTQKIFRYNLIKEFRVAVMQTGKKMVLNILLDIANELPVGDCLTLIEANLPLMATLFTSTWTTNKRRSESTMKKITSVILKLLHQPENDEERHQSIILRNIFDELNISFNQGEFRVGKYQYWQLFSSPWSSDITFEERHLELNKKISAWLVLQNDKHVERSDPTKKDLIHKPELVDEYKLFLMGNILLFSSFGIGSRLEQLDTVEAIQEDMVTLLHRYLIYQYGLEKSTLELARSMDIISMTREAFEIQRRRLPV